MSGVALNRITIVLGFIGIFVAGYLSLGHILGISLPCGVSHGCDIVAAHPTSYVYGNQVDGGLPVAYVGLIGYFLLSILAVVRGVKGVQNTKPLVTIGFLASAVGAIYSGYLTYTALYVIKATCIWCLASAITMVLTTVVYAAMLQADAPESDKGDSKFDIVLASVSFLVAAIGLGAGGAMLKANGEKVSIFTPNIINDGKIPLFNNQSHFYGPIDAPITIVEFADMLCPACQATFPKLEELVKNSNGKIRLVFHHYPLFMKEDHKMALPAATIAEIAGEQGKFFPFISAMYSKTQDSLQTPESLFAVAEAIGVDTTKLAKRMEDPKDPAILKVTEDINLANQIKITSTPTLFLSVEGHPVIQIAPSALEAKLTEEPYKSLMAGGSTGK